MNLPWNCIPTPDQLAADHWQDSDVLDNDVHCAFVNPPSQIDSYSTAATNILPSVSNFGSWNNTPIPYSTQCHNPALGGASIDYSSFPALESGYSTQLTSQGVYPNGRSSQSNISSQHTVATIHTPFFLDPTMPPSDFLRYNILPHQWQTHVVPQPRHLSLPVTPMIPPPLVAEHSRFIYAMQPHVSPGEQTGYSSNYPPVHQPYSFPLHAHPSSSLLSCQWLNDDTVTHCGFTGTLKALESHCKTIHFTGTRIAQIECHWKGCDYYKRNDPTVRVMRRDCMWRHTCEVHLRLKRGSV